MAATEHFSFRPTAEDMELLKKFSAETGMTMSDVVRRSIRLGGPALVAGLQAAQRMASGQGAQP